MGLVADVQMMPISFGHVGLKLNVMELCIL